MCDLNEDFDEALVNIGGDCEVEPIDIDDLATVNEDNEEIIAEPLSSDSGCEGDQVGKESTNCTAIQSTSSLSLPVQPDDLLNEIKKIWHEGITGDSDNPEESLLKNSPTTILEQIINTESIILDTIEPTLCQVVENGEAFNQVLTEKDIEIANLKLANKEQKFEIENLTKKLQKLQSPKTVTKSSQPDKPIDRLQSENARAMKIHKNFTQKEKAMTNTINALQQQLEETQQSVQQLMNERENLEKETVEQLQKEIQDALRQLEAAEKEAMEMQKSAVESVEKFYRLKFEETIQKERAKLAEKAEQVSLWEHDLKERENNFKESNSILEVRNRLLAMLEAREAQK